MPRGLAQPDHVANVATSSLVIHNRLNRRHCLLRHFEQGRSLHDLDTDEMSICLTQNSSWPTAGMRVLYQL
jgi:hypothetical protein